jgi:hypothetical protein
VLPLLAGICGCTFDGHGLSPLPSDHAGAPADRSSSEGIDALVGDRGLADSPRPDDGLPRADLHKVDGKPKADLPEPDAKPKADLPKVDGTPKADLPEPDGPPPTCDDLFKSKVPGYVACTPPDTTTCRFYFNAASATSCTTLCGIHPCQKMEDNDPSVTCNAESPNLCGSSSCQCNTTMFDSLCTCKK